MLNLIFFFFFFSYQLKALQDRFGFRANELSSIAVSSYCILSNVYSFGMWQNIDMWIHVYIRIFIYVNAHSYTIFCVAFHLSFWIIYVHLCMRVRVCVFTNMARLWCVCACTYMHLCICASFKYIPFLSIEICI